MENNFIGICQYFKNISTPEKVVALMNDKKLIAAILAWKSVIIKRKSDEEDNCCLTEDNERWDWLWDMVEWDNQKYLLVSGLKVQDVETSFERLKGLKLIYPDGTVDKFATQYLNSIIMKALKTKS